MCQDEPSCILYSKTNEKQGDVSYSSRNEGLYEEIGCKVDGRGVISKGSEVFHLRANAIHLGTGRIQSLKRFIYIPKGQSKGSGSQDH